MDARIIDLRNEEMDARIIDLRNEEMDARIIDFPGKGSAEQKKSD